MKYLVVVILVIVTIDVSRAFYEGGDDENLESGFLGKIRGYAGEIGSVLRDVAHGIRKVGKGIKSVEEFLDATIDEDCYFECENGEPPLSKQGHEPSSNGCGSFGLEEYLKDDILPLTNFIHCCNAHDRCYDTCGTDKDECDLFFKKCLYKECRDSKDTMGKLKYKGCQAGAKLLFTGTTALGCKPFMNAQRKACYCPLDVDQEHDEL